jgi:hypothetical protein
MKNTVIVVCLIAAFLWTGMVPASAHSPEVAQNPGSDWSGPVFVAGYSLTHPDIDSLGAQMIFIDGNSNNYDDNAKNLMLSQFENGGWSAPEVLASNAIYSTSLFQDPPRDTSPVISGDGETIAYLGYDSTNPGYRLFIVDKVGGVWGTPYSYSGYDGCVDNEMDISEDGNMIVFSNCPQFFSTMRVYIAQRAAGVWAPYQIVSGSGSYDGGAQGSISADGKKIIYQESSHLFFVEQLADGSWSGPLNLTHCYLDEYAENYYLYHPKISPDGNAVFYWRFDIDSSSGQNVVKAKALYTMRRFGGSWSAPVRISGAPIVPDLSTGSAPAVDKSGTRVIFSRALWGDPFSGSRLEVTELVNGKWTQPVPFTAQHEALYPNMNLDGKTVVFRYFTDQDVGVASMSTADASPGYAYQFTTNTISAGGGELAGTSMITATFASGSFSETVEATLTSMPGAAKLPQGIPWTNIGSGFDLFALRQSTNMPEQVDAAHPFSIVVQYQDQLIPAIESSLKLYAWNAEVCSWTPLDSVLDMDQNTVSAASVDHLGLFAVHGDSLHAFLPAVIR